MYFKLSRRSINQRKARLLKKGMRRKTAIARFMVDQAINHSGVVIGTK
jgi:ABC-type Na+ transport system ATPase subunit NatA